MNQRKGANLETLLSMAEAIALKKADGHLTIFRYTTNWKVMLCTPDLISGTDCVSGSEKGELYGPYQELRELKGYPTLEKALKAFIISEF